MRSKLNEKQNAAWAVRVRLKRNVLVFHQSHRRLQALMNVHRVTWGKRHVNNLVRRCGGSVFRCEIQLETNNEEIICHHSHIPSCGDPALIDQSPGSSILESNPWQQGEVSFFKRFPRVRSWGPLTCLICELFPGCIRLKNDSHIRFRLLVTYLSFGWSQLFVTKVTCLPSVCQVDEKGGDIFWGNDSARHQKQTIF